MSKNNNSSNLCKEKDWIWKRLKFFDDGAILLNQLYLYFDIQEDFSVWVKEVIKKYNLIEDEDYFTFENEFKNDDELYNKIYKINYALFYNSKNNNLVLDVNTLLKRRLKELK